MQIPVSSNIPHCKWRPEFQYYNDRSALDNSSEGPKICNYSTVAPDPSITAPFAYKEAVPLSTQQLRSKTWLLFCCLLALCWLRHRSDAQQGNNKPSEARIFSHSEEPSVMSWPLTSTVRNQRGNEQFPKHNQSFWKQRKMIPLRNLMSRFLNVSLFCEHKHWAPAVLWQTTMIWFHFLLVYVMRPAAGVRCQTSQFGAKFKSFDKEKEWTWLKKDPSNDSCCNKRRY